MKIQRLKMEDYKKKPFEVRYQTNYLYEPVLHQTPDCLGVLFQRTALDEPMSCDFDDVWGSSWLESPQLYALYDNNEIAGMIEVSMESWTQRLRISNLLIKPAYRSRDMPACLYLM